MLTTRLIQFLSDGKPPENMARPDSVTEADEELRQTLRNKADERYRLRRRPGAAEAKSMGWRSPALHDEYDTAPLKSGLSR